MLHIDAPTAVVVSGLIGFAGALAARLLDFVLLRMGKVPTDGVKFRVYASKEMRSMRNQIRALSGQVRVLREHIDDCEKDRAEMAAEISELKSEREDIERRIASLGITA